MADTFKYNGREWDLLGSNKNYDESVKRELIEETIKKGKPLTQSEISGIIGTDVYGVDWKFYTDLIDANQNNLGYNSDVFLDDKNNPTRVLNESRLSDFLKNKQTSSKSDYESMVEAAYEDRLNLMTDPTGANAQRFRDTMYGAIANEQAVAEQSLGQAELDAYRMLGQQQLELENTIAEQRKKALVSGTTSAQLAAGQLQNMFAAQSGAAQVAQSLANQRTQMNQAFAEKRTGVETSLYDYINQQQTIAATAGAQNLAALSSYASYANKNYNDMMSLYNAKNSMSNTEFEKLVEIIQGTN